MQSKQMPAMTGRAILSASVPCPACCLGAGVNMIKLVVGEAIARAIVDGSRSGVDVITEAGVEVSTVVGAAIVVVALIVAVL